MNCFSVRTISIASITALILVTISVSVTEAQLFRRYQRPQPAQSSSSSSSRTTGAQYWANSFSPNTKVKDFGAVPRASKQEFVFEFENTMDTAIIVP